MEEVLQCSFHYRKYKKSILKSDMNIRSRLTFLNFKKKKKKQRLKSKNPTTFFQVFKNNS